MERGLEIA